MVYAKRLPYKRRPRARRGKRTTFAKKVLAVVRKTREIKQKTFAVSGYRFVDTPLGNNIEEIMGTIAQGTGNDERIGTEINLLSIQFRGQVRYTHIAGVPITAYARLMILRQKNVGSAHDIVVQPALYKANDLLQNDQPWTSTILDTITPINRDAFTVKKQIKLKLQNASNFQGNDSMPVSSLSSRLFTYNMKFGAGKRITYDSNDTPLGIIESNNFPFFLLPCAAKVDGSPLANAVTGDFTFTVKYTDA